MNRIAMSGAAASLLRALAGRAGVEKNRILLIEADSTDWQSLTFTGERHRLSLKILGTDAGTVADRLCDGLGDAELDLPGQIVADISVAEGPNETPDQAVEFVIEALTVASD